MLPLDFKRNLNDILTDVESFSESPSILGVLRTLAVEVINHPLKTVKIHQQTGLYPPQSSSKRILEIARAIYTKHGISGFYVGFGSQTSRSLIKPAWQWPLITQFPDALEYQFSITNSSAKQAVCGCVIATLDSLIATPIEKRMIRSVLKHEKAPSWKHILWPRNGFIQETWGGFGSVWRKQTVAWSAFLTSQSFFREFFVTEKKGYIPLKNCIMVGTLSATVVFAFSALFDYGQTIKQGHNIDLRQAFSQSTLPFNQKLKMVYKGSSLYFISLVINNIGSAILLHHFENLKQRKSHSC